LLFYDTGFLSFGDRPLRRNHFIVRNLIEQGNSQLHFFRAAKVKEFDIRKEDTKNLTGMCIKYQTL